MDIRLENPLSKKAFKNTFLKINYFKSDINSLKPAVLTQ